MAKESGINKHNHKNMTTVIIYIHDNRASKHLYRNTTYYTNYSLVISLYKTTIKFTKLVLDVEQFGASSNLIIPTPDV